MNNFFSVPAFATFSIFTSNEFLTRRHRRCTSRSNNQLPFNMCLPISITPSKQDIAVSSLRTIQAAPGKPQEHSLHSLSTQVCEEDPLECVCLPQQMSAENRMLRHHRILCRREQYQWTYSTIPSAALISSLPSSEKPNRRWIVMMKRVEDRCKLNFDTVTQNTKDISNTEKGVIFSDVDAFRKYKQQFATIKLPDIARNNRFLRDDIFGWYRVAGPNPMELRRLKTHYSHMFPLLNNEVFCDVQSFDDDSLELAQSENRLFVLDYSRISQINISDGSCLEGKSDMHLYSPRVLFAVPKNATAGAPILPIAIYCDAQSDVMHTASKNYSSESAWQAAKLTVQVTDAYVHETVHHFARTHLLMESIICATHRSLASTHPIMKLLTSHFEGTAFINETSLRALLCSGGTIDRITAPPIEKTRQFAAQSLTSDFNFNDAMPDVDFSNRGVDKDTTPLLCYPYRDDAMDLWNAILNWTTDYIAIFYQSDEDVKQDYEIQIWGMETTVNGKIKGFGDNELGQIRSKVCLCRTVSMIIFVASVQHGAVNFPQKELMQFVPAMPLAGYAAPPKLFSRHAHGDESDVLMYESMLPKLEQCEEQIRAAELLGVVRYTRLGEYGKHLDFGGKLVSDALLKFQTRLRELETRIEQRNFSESDADLPVYSFLRPSLIPQSINV